VKTFVVVVIYYDAQPVAYEVHVNSRAEALTSAWTKYEHVSDHIKKIIAVPK